MKSALLSRVVLVPGVLSGEDAAALRRLPCDVPGGVSAALVAEIESGQAKVCQIVDGGERVGFVVFAVTDSHELVVHAAFGRDRRENLVEWLIGHGELVQRLARQCECDSVRFHTVRPGLVARAQACGFRVSEVVMRKDVR